MKQFLSFAILCASVLSIGGTIYLFYDHHYLFGAVNILLTAMALPYIIKQVKTLFGK